MEPGEKFNRARATCSSKGVSGERGYTFEIERSGGGPEGRFVAASFVCPAGTNGGIVAGGLLVIGEGTGRVRGSVTGSGALLSLVVDGRGSPFGGTGVADGAFVDGSRLARRRCASESANRQMSQPSRPRQSPTANHVHNCEVAFFFLGRLYLGRWRTGASLHWRAEGRKCRFNSMIGARSTTIPVPSFA